MWGAVVALILLLNNLNPSLARPLASIRTEAHGELKHSQIPRLSWKQVSANFINLGNIQYSLIFRLGAANVVN